MRPKRCVEERVVLRVGYEWVISYFAPCRGVDGVCTADRNGGVVVMLAGANGASRRIFDRKRIWLKQRLLPG